MKSVDFLFEIDQMVKTPFGEPGIVDMQGCDGEGRKYFIKTATNSQWFKEDQLSKLN